MSRAVRVIWNDLDRQCVANWSRKAPIGTEVQFKKNKRSLPQNARFWAMLSDIAGQILWHGVRLTTDDWKLVFLDALKREMRMVPNIDGNGFVNLGRSSSDLTVEEMGDLMTVMERFGAEHGVVFHDDRQTGTA